MPLSPGNESILLNPTKTKKMDKVREKIVQTIKYLLTNKSTGIFIAKS